ncbi:pseudouridine synthase [Serinibacter salmoneus]|uniref:Pseudouridine synthase n=1 Tax=Serinibacter salmoneus TaxID=556530 RepID=A0A2A9CZ82_9MICO|nr:pseudouridine synthase [Serinibacter salmoneus]PFG19713.1 ribosomal large subunit pseudouridine synthase B [Serinibacter salmoneus]
MSEETSGRIRLQKVLAGAGFGSRRACENLIVDGRVSVNGEVTDQLGSRMDPAVDTLHVDGLRVQLDASSLTLALNKPAGVLSAMSDDRGRPTLAPWVESAGTRLVHVGRLDAETTGLLLLTNDGELAHRLAHPSYEVPKTYVATVRGSVGAGARRALLAGIDLEDGAVRADTFKVLEARANASVVQLSLHSGRNRIVRRMLEAVGHPVTQLTRTQVGAVRLGSLREGETRVVAGTELGTLMAQVGL